MKDYLQLTCFSQVCKVTNNDQSSSKSITEGAKILPSINGCGMKNGDAKGMPEFSSIFVLFGRSSIFVTCDNPLDFTENKN